MMTSIKSEAEYQQALAEIERLVDQDPEAGSPESDQLNVLALLVHYHEQKQLETLEVDPVDAIRFRMEQMNLNARDLVPLIGSRSKVSEILSRKRPLTLSMVRALHKGLGIPAKALLREPSLFDLTEDTIEWNRFPVREMSARGWLDETTLSNDPRSILERYFAPLGSNWAPAALYKRTYHVRSARQMDQYALAAWKARVCIRALATPPPVPFERAQVTSDFLRELAHLSTFADGPRKAVSFLWDAGLSVIIEPHLTDTYIDGAAILATQDRPVIGLTLRYDRIDNFWFVLLHELIHVAQHLGPVFAVFYDDLDVEEMNNDQEREADELAAEALIPKSEWERSPARYLRTPEAVYHLAKRLQIHPAIVAGKIRHHYKSYRVLNRLVGQGEVRRLFPQETANVKDQKED